jgi:GntR family transcriptional repressor for pyruvate dehydrogenase complex
LGLVIGYVMEGLKFERLSISRASEHIEKKIKEAILNRMLKPGDRLPTEKDMATQFGVSIVTLREALRGLEIFGLIEKRKGLGGGVFISEIDNDSIKASLGHYLSFKYLSPQHLYQVRKIIEPSAIKLAVENITADELGKIEENVSYCEEKMRNVGSVLDEIEFFDLDKKNNDFHRLIAEGTHNPILILTIDYVFDFLWECETNILIPDTNYTMDNIRDHRNILEYLKKGEAEKCEEQMLHHLMRLDEYLLKKEKVLREPEGAAKENNLKKGWISYTRRKGINRK